MWILLWATASASADLASIVALHRRTDGVVQGPDVLEQLYGAACTAGRELACRWRAWDDFGRANDVDLARLAEPACGVGDQEACLLLAWAAPGDTVEDRVRALDTVCAGGIPRACAEVGTMLLTDPLSRPAERTRAVALLRDACAAGAAIACRRAAEAGEAAYAPRATALGDPAFLPPATGCAQGLVSACVIELSHARGPERLALLERLCRMDDAHCAALAAERRSAPGTVQAGQVTRVFWVDGAVLLGWDTSGSWTDHARIEMSQIASATLHTERARREWLVLALDDGSSIPLPVTDCDHVVAGAVALEAAGRPARALAPEGGPGHSVCIDMLGPGRGPKYRSGTLTLTTVADPSADVGQVHQALAEGADAVYRCAEAEGGIEPRLPWRASFLASRNGAVTRVKVLERTNDPSLDLCFAAWLAAADLGPRLQPISFTVEVEVPY